MRNALILTALIGLALPATAAPNIPEVASQAGSFRMLVGALQQARLVEALDAPGPFTVFAPVDAAFARLPRSLTEELFEDRNRDRLQSILTFHVVPGRITAARLLLSRELKTLNGETLRIASRNGRLTVGGALVKKVDVAAGNGVIHVIDGVLVPKNLGKLRLSPVRETIGQAIETGAPLYNHGNQTACAAVYETAARNLLTLAGDALSAGDRAILEMGLANAGRERDAEGKAWAIRKAFDRILEGKGKTMSTTTEAKPAAPKRNPYVEEAKLPAGFPLPGAVGEVEMKQYPRYRMARAKGGMFAFGTLFNHIKKNDIAMTAPVEMTMDDDRMRTKDMAFLYASTELGKKGADGRVEVTDVEPMTVLSYGMTGPVSAERLRMARQAIEAKLGDRWVRAGDWRMMGYNSPMVPEKRRFYEIQLPVEPASDG